MECSEVKVKVTQNKTTPVKYRYLKNVLKYSNEEVLLRYWPPLHIIQWHISMSYILVNIMGIVTITVVDNYQDRMISKTNFVP